PWETFKSGVRHDPRRKDDMRRPVEGPAHLFRRTYVSSEFMDQGDGRNTKGAKRSNNRTRFYAVRHRIERPIGLDQAFGDQPDLKRIPCRVSQRTDDHVAF